MSREAILKGKREMKSNLIRKLGLILSTGIAALTCASAAQAVDVWVSYYGNYYENFQFKIRENVPGPNLDGFTGTQSFYMHASGVYDGVPSVLNFQFFADFMGGGFILSGTPINTVGAQVFGGDTGQPYFYPGVFKLSENSDPSKVAGVLAITLDTGVAPPLPSVPEPASWAMFIGGFGLIGGAMRRRKVALSFG